MSEVTYKGIENLKAIRFHSYKCFSADDQPFEIRTDKYMTLIIGRNNCGKSSLVDIIEGAIGPDNKNGWEYITEDVKNLEYVYQIDESRLRYGFSEKYLYSDVEKCLGSTISLQFPRNVDNHLKKPIITVVPEGFITIDSGMKANWEDVALGYTAELKDVCFRRLNADRDIVPELEDESEDVAPNGQGAVNLLRKFINEDKYDEKFVEKTILGELNKLIQPETTFTQLRVQQIDENDSRERKWEIFLKEGDKRFALSKSGSGLKTLLLVLVNLYLVPQVINRGKGKKQEIVYAFEEVENNLHPSLQRRLFDYLYWYSVTNRVKIFITSHSHVAINTYYQLKEAQIYHVTKNGGKSKLELSIGKPDLMEMLNDLNVKASDMFQANGIIWVEGPSDRIYILSWMKAFFDDILDNENSYCPDSKKYVEGLHFQFLYYGGRLLSHYTASDESDQNLINMLITNRNAAIVMDSDKRTADSKYNETKQRVIKEFNNHNMFSWLTAGREIENYLPAEIVEKAFGPTVQQVDAYGDFGESLGEACKDYSSKKVFYARKISAHTNKNALEGMLDLKEKIAELHKTIVEWNI